MRKPGKVAVHGYTDGGGIVRGVTDPVMAFKYLVDEHILGGVNLEGALNAARQLLPDSDLPPDDPDVLADEAFTWIERTSVGRYRMLPGQMWDPDWNWCVMRQDDDARGRGIFSAVEFYP